MKLGRSTLGALAGVLLGLGIVALTAAGGVPAAAPPVAQTPAKAGSNSTALATFGTSSSIAPANQLYSAIGFANTSGVPSQLNSIGRQPIPLTLFVLLPVLSAAILGFALYRWSMGRTREELSEPE